MAKVQVTEAYPHTTSGTMVVRPYSIASAPRWEDVAATDDGLSDSPY